MKNIIKHWIVLALAVVLCMSIGAPALAAEDGADTDAREPFYQAQDAWEAGDEAGALEMYRQAAEQGDPDAQEIVGEFYEKAAALGEEHAQAWLDAHGEDGGE